MPHPLAPPRYTRTVALAFVSTLMSGQAMSGGFALSEHGASGLGNAYAGAAAISEDGSTAWWNPAGLTELPEREFSLTAHVLRTSTVFENRGTTLGAALGGGDISGPDSTNAGTNTLLPNLYYVAPINDRWSYGLSVGVPFGSSTDYDEEWVGRYTTVRSGINVVDINPSIGWRVSDSVRIGVGVSLQLLSAELSSAVDSGAVCLAVFSAAPENCFEAGLTPGNVDRDGLGDVSGDSTGFGFNIGALFLPTDSTKIGVTFRSGVDHQLDGEGEFTTDDALRGLLDSVGSSLLTTSDASADVSLPPLVAVSVAQKLGQRFELLGDLTWTGWSSLQEIRIEYENEQQPDTLSVIGYEDVFRISAAVNYQLNDRVKLRGGWAFDEEAVVGPETRTARLPGNDRTWIAAGLGYQASDSLSFDVGYVRILLPDTAIDNQNLETPGGSVVRGTFDSSVDIFSAQVNWTFN